MYGEIVFLKYLITILPFYNLSRIYCHHFFFNFLPAFIMFLIYLLPSLSRNFLSFTSFTFYQLPNFLLYLPSSYMLYLLRNYIFSFYLLSSIKSSFIFIFSHYIYLCEFSFTIFFLYPLFFHKISVFFIVYLLRKINLLLLSKIELIYQLGWNII